MTKTAKKHTRKTPAAKSASKTRDQTKSSLMIALLERSEGASIAELMRATGWQAHSIRGFLAGSLKKQGKNVASSVPEDKVRRYRLAGTA